MLNFVNKMVFKNETYRIIEYSNNWNFLVANNPGFLSVFFFEIK